MTDEWREVAVHGQSILLLRPAGEIQADHIGKPVFQIPGERPLVPVEVQPLPGHCLLDFNLLKTLGLRLPVDVFADCLAAVIPSGRYSAVCALSDRAFGFARFGMPLPLIECLIAAKCPEKHACPTAGSVTGQFTLARQSPGD